MQQSPALLLCAAAAAVVGGIGCNARLSPADRLVLAQTPAGAEAPAGADVLDARYPPGSRVVLISAPFTAGPDRILSAGFSAAGQPVLSHDAERVLFAGKRNPGDAWQIFEVPLRKGRPRAWTAAPGGAMSPALLGDGRLVFASPVPRSAAEAAASPPAIHLQARGEPPERISFAPAGLFDPAVLADGRILAVGFPPSASSGTDRALYTINNDGTEIMGFAGHHEAAGGFRRPRELMDGRVTVVVDEDGDGAGSAESIAMARPYAGRTPLLADASIRVHAVEPAGADAILVAAAHPAGGSALYRIGRRATALGDPLVADPAWDILAGLSVLPRRPPMGRLSTVKPGATTALFLCLDANESTVTNAAGAVETATRVRVLTAAAPGDVHSLGEVDLQPDGSFMAEVPADVPIGFEALDADGRVVRRLPPLIWMRPGDNRGCIGCHEPHNHAPRNQRPMAVNAPIPKLGELAQGPAAAP